MIKHLEIADPQSCLNKADDKEPLFVLRAHDVLAPGIVRQWADTLLAKRSSVEKDPEKFEQITAKTTAAYQLAHEMDEWQAANGFKLPD